MRRSGPGIQDAESLPGQRDRRGGDGIRLLRDASLAQKQADVFNERLGFLVLVRNSLMTASLALAALEQSQLSVSGATGGVPEEKRPEHEAPDQGGAGRGAARVRGFQPESSGRGLARRGAEAARLCGGKTCHLPGDARGRGHRDHRQPHPAAGGARQHPPERLQVHPRRHAGDPECACRRERSGHRGCRPLQWGCPRAQRTPCSSPSRNMVRIAPGWASGCRSPGAASRQMGES